MYIHSSKPRLVAMSLLAAVSVLATSALAESLVLDTGNPYHITPPSDPDHGIWSSSLLAGQDYWIEVEGTWLRDSIHWCDGEWYEPDPNQPWLEDYAGDPGFLDVQIDEISPDWLGFVDINGNGIAEPDEWFVHTLSPTHRYGLTWIGDGQPIKFSVYDLGYENSGELNITITTGPPMVTVPVGNPRNPGEMSGEAAGPDGRGQSRECGYVNREYEIGMFEVTAAQYVAFLNSVAKTDTYGLYNPLMGDPNHAACPGCNIQQTGSEGNWNYDVPEDWANRPVNFVSWGDAARYANWLHNGQPTGPQDATTTEDGSYALNGTVTDEALIAVKRKATATWVISSEDEWYKAAYHMNNGTTGDYWDYPTANDVTPGRDVTEATTPGNNANYLGTPFPIDAPFHRTVVGEFELSTSPYGTFDQGGNVSEWNEAAIGSERGTRGGNFGNIVHALHAANRIDSHPPTFEHCSVGFRVAYAPYSFGDANCDGAVDVFDIDPFVLAVTDPGEYDVQYPNCSIELLDCNQDGYVDVFDIDAFVAIVVGG